MATRPARILVVDDNRDNADSCSTLLQMVGHQVRVAYAGTEALAIGAEFRPHLVLVDIGMPGMSGYDLAHQVRAERWGQSVVLAAITGHSTQQDKVNAIEAGFDHHFTKPLELEVLQPLIDSSRAAAGD